MRNPECSRMAEKSQSIDWDRELRDLYIAKRMFVLATRALIAAHGIAPMGNGDQREQGTG